MLCNIDFVACDSLNASLHSVELNSSELQRKFMVLAFNQTCRRTTQVLP
jgi:hypothetical protein